MKKHLIIVAIIATAIFATGSSFDEDILVPEPIIEERKLAESNFGDNIFDNNKVIESVRVNGVVKEVKDGQIIIITDMEYPEEITILNVSNAYYIDMLKADYTDIKSVKAGETIAAYCNPIAPMIYPPRLGVRMILINNGKEGAAALRIITGESITDEDTDEETDVEPTRIGYKSGGGEYVIWFYEGVETKDNAGNSVDVGNIKEGTEMLIWCDMILPSYPAQVNAKKAVVLSNANVQAEEEAEADNSVKPRPVVISGDNLILYGDMVYAVMEKDKSYTTEQNITMYPVRTIAEALGTAVEWERGTVTIITGNITRAIFKINESSYSYLGAFEILNEGNTFQLIDGKAYAPKEFFERVLNCYFE